MVGAVVVLVLALAGAAVPVEGAPKKFLNACAGTSQPGYWLRQLEAVDPSARAKAARALGEMGDAAAVPALMEALKDPDPEVRRAAARALEKVRQPR